MMGLCIWFLSEMSDYCRSPPLDQVIVCCLWRRLFFLSPTLLHLSVFQRNLEIWNFTCTYFILFWDRALLCSLDCPRIHYVVLAVLKQRSSCLCLPVHHHAWPCIQLKTMQIRHAYWDLTYPGILLSALNVNLNLASYKVWPWTRHLFSSTSCSVEIIGPLRQIVIGYVGLNCSLTPGMCWRHAVLVFV